MGCGFEPTVRTAFRIQAGTDARARESWSVRAGLTADSLITISIGLVQGTPPTLVSIIGGTSGAFDSASVGVEPPIGARFDGHNTTVPKTVPT